MYIICSIEYKINVYIKTMFNVSVAEPQKATELSLGAFIVVLYVNITTR